MDMAAMTWPVFPVATLFFKSTAGGPMLARGHLTLNLLLTRRFLSTGDLVDW